MQVFNAAAAAFADAMKRLDALDPEGGAMFREFAADPTWCAFAELEKKTYRRIRPLLDDDELSFDQLARVWEVLRGFAAMWAEDCLDADIRATYRAVVNWYDGNPRFQDVRARSQQMRAER
jgi:hypothetical protein